MMKNKLNVILVYSSKGGVGTTTVSLGIYSTLTNELNSNFEKVKLYDTTSNKNLTKEIVQHKAYKHGSVYLETGDIYPVLSNLAIYSEMGYIPSQPEVRTVIVDIPYYADIFNEKIKPLIKTLDPVFVVPVFPIFSGEHGFTETITSILGLTSKVVPVINTDRERKFYIKEAVNSYFSFIKQNHLRTMETEEGETTNMFYKIKLDSITFPPLAQDYKDLVELINERFNDLSLTDINIC